MANPLQNWFHSRSSLQPGIRLAAGLLDLGRAAHVSQDEILDLLAYLKAGGNPADPEFKAPGQKKP